MGSVVFPKEMCSVSYPATGLQRGNKGRFFCLKKAKLRDCYFSSFFSTECDFFVVVVV